VAVLPIIEYPDPRLRLRSSPVTEFDDGLVRFVDDLLDTLYSTDAIGLSAPQVDVQREVLVMDLSGSASAPQVYVNPEILKGAAPGFVEERCVSVPGVVVNVLRNTRVRVRATDRHGERFERDLEGMEAVCLQHEMDHLVGTTLVERMSFFRRLRMRRAAARA